MYTNPKPQQPGKPGWWLIPPGKVQLVPVPNERPVTFRDMETLATRMIINLARIGGAVEGITCFARVEEYGEIVLGLLRQSGVGSWDKFIQANANQEAPRSAIARLMLLRVKYYLPALRQLEAAKAAASSGQ